MRISSLFLLLFDAAAFVYGVAMFVPLLLASEFEQAVPWMLGSVVFALLALVNLQGEKIRELQNERKSSHVQRV